MNNFYEAVEDLRIKVSLTSGIDLKEDVHLVVSWSHTNSDVPNYETNLKPKYNAGSTLPGSWISSITYEY